MPRSATRRTCLGFQGNLCSTACTKSGQVVILHTCNSGWMKVGSAMIRDGADGTSCSYFSQSNEPYCSFRLSAAKTARSQAQVITSMSSSRVRDRPLYCRICCLAVRTTYRVSMIYALMRSGSEFQVYRARLLPRA